MTTATTTAPTTAVPATTRVLAREPRRVALAAAFGASVLALTGAGVYAALSATATNTTPQAVSSGTLRLTLAGAGGAASFSDAVANLAPGDAVRRHVDLVNGGTLDGRALGLSVTPGATNALTSNLAVTVRGCSTAWVASTGTCTSGATTLLPATPLTTLATRQALSDGASAAGTTRHLQVEVALADVTETVVNGTLPAATVQGLTAALTYEFGMVQQTARTTSS
jgi:hypothetical protein